MLPFLSFQTHSCHSQIFNLKVSPHKTAILCTSMSRYACVVCPQTGCCAHRLWNFSVVNCRESRAVSRSIYSSIRCFCTNFSSLEPRLVLGNSEQRTRSQRTYRISKKRNTVPDRSRPLFNNVRATFLMGDAKMLSWRLWFHVRYSPASPSAFAHFSVSHPISLTTLPLIWRQTCSSFPFIHQ